MMGDIFGGANTVLVWLGRKTLATKIALMKFRWLLSPMTIPELEELKEFYTRPRNTTAFVFTAFIAATILPALQWVLGRGFFERVWTLQEVVLAKDIVFYLGDELLPLGHLVKNFQYLDDESTNVSATEHSWAGATWLGLHSLVFMLRMRTHHIQGRHYTLETAITEARRRKSTKPADKVFAILSISDRASITAGDLRANYRKDTAKVYCECARALILGPTGLRLLSLVGQLRHGCTDHPSFPFATTKHLIKNVEFEKELPSWVPDLTAQVFSLMFPTIQLSQQFTSCDRFLYTF